MSVGPFYYLYLAPDWKLFAKPVSDEASSIGHPAFWRVLCADIVAPHYGIADAKQISALSEHCYAMPRGRCAMMIPRRRRIPRELSIYHGGEFPLGAKSQRALIEAFGLRQEHKSGRLKFQYDEHETMQADDQRRIQEIIGAVPYS